MGRFVKLHQISSALLNSFSKGDRTVATMWDGNDKFLVKMRGGAEYHMAIDNISKHVNRNKGK